MIRAVLILGIACLVGLAAFVYRIKYESAGLNREITKLERAIDGERDSIAALKAQFSALSKPSRLQGLAERHLAHLKPFSVSQMASIRDIPERLPDLGDFIDKLPLGAGLPVVDSEVGSPTGTERKPVRPPTPAKKTSRPLP